ncbi:MAG TPA: hypothetical protein VHP83_16355 [Aggregatilineaceae bacterium]|nr:hypothetical protein [Aggregatilineaceae bacterium]
MKTRWVMVLVLVMVAAAPLSMTARAQDGGGLTDEQIALLDRIVAARMVRDAWPAYTEDASGSQAYSIVEPEQTSIRASALEHSATVIPGETDDNTQAVVAASVISSVTVSDGTEESVEYTISGEARIVDGVMYVNVAYDEPNDQLPPLAEGWVQINSVEELDAYTALDALALSDLYEESDLEELNAMIEMYKQYATDVTLEQTTLEDGTTADVITITLDSVGVAEYMKVQDASSPLFDLLLTDDAPDSYTFRMTLDAENNPIAIEGVMSIAGVGLDAALFGSSYPEGSTIDVTVEAEQVAVYTPILEGVEPAVVPDEVVPAP